MFVLLHKYTNLWYLIKNILNKVIIFDKVFFILMKGWKMKRNALIIALIALPFAFAWVIPTPTGLSEAAWVAFGVYLSAILGLVFRPIPNSMVLIVAVSGTALLMGSYLGGGKRSH